jgi:hypothetical protein
MIMAIRMSLIALLLTMAGCRAPWIQYPQLRPGSPEAERASFSQHDLLPDSSLGPNVSSRPREALTQRGEPRRTLEAAIPTMIQSGSPANMQPMQSDYPASVVP